MSVNPPEGTLTIENSHLDVKGNVSAVALKLGTLRLTPSYGLDAVANVSNSTTHTLELSNATTGLVTTSNVVVGKDLAVSGNATVSSNLTVSGNVSLTGTGSIVVPVGTTAQRPATGLSGMVRFDSDLDALQIYNGTTWSSVGSMYATGGTLTTVDGYRIHSFTSSGDFVVSTTGVVEYLVIGGGGGGGGNHGAGGGAGGFLQGQTLIKSGSYSVVIGGGGAGSTQQGTNGSDSTVIGLTAVGGGGGGKGYASGGASASSPGSVGASSGGGGPFHTGTNSRHFGKVP